MHDLPLLTNIGVALSAALLGGLVARRIGLPPIVGYLLAGTAIGPFTPGFVGDQHAIGQLAELGVIFLMFGVGSHFSFGDLWRVRGIAVPGAVIQMGLSTGLGYLLATMWGWSAPASLLFGIALSIASTVVLLRALMDRGLLGTPHGQVAVGWLVLEDIATVAILVLLPVVAGEASAGGITVALWAIGKALVFVALVAFGGKRVVRWLLARVAATGSRELFVVTSLVVAIGTALAAAYLFGISLALGAFVAGVLVGQSRFGHQVSADLLPFRDAFAVLFFVSVGLLVNPAYLAAHWAEVALLSALVVFGKAFIAAAIVFASSRAARTGLVVAAGLSQVGEFSFIVGQAGLAHGILDHDQYSMILAGALVSITVNPAMFAAIDPVERWLRRAKGLWRWIDRTPRGLDAVRAHAPEDHVVVIGCGRIGRQVIDVLRHLGVPFLVVDTDAKRIEALHAAGIRTLYGDAGTSEILEHAGLAQARAVVVAVPDAITARLAVTTARAAAPNVHIIARGSSAASAQELADAGADETVYPELEGGLQMIRRTLLWLDFPIREVHRYTDVVRRQRSHGGSPDAAQRVLEDLVRTSHDLELSWLTVGPGSECVGKTLSETALRARTGASVVAIAREGSVQANPEPGTRLACGDRVAVIGTARQVEDAARWLEPPPAITGAPPSA